jgi:WhiB family redox-sensing transcriptional regulator
MTDRANRGSGADHNQCSAVRHGTRSAVHHYQCVCPDAVEKYRRYERLSANGAAHLSADVDHRVDRRPSIHRVQALYAIGHTQPDLAKRLGYGSQKIPFIHMHGRTRIYQSTASRVAAVYEELRHTPGPSKDNMRRARHNRWWTPAQWDLVNIDDGDADPGAVITKQDHWTPRISTDSYTEDGKLILCRTHPNPDLWYGTKARETRSAITICMRCPVIRDCLSNALINNESWGTWGGLSETQRRHVRKVLVHRLDGNPVEGSPELDNTLDTFAGPLNGDDKQADQPVVQAPAGPPAGQVSAA